MSENTETATSEASSNVEVASVDNSYPSAGDVAEHLGVEVDDSDNFFSGDDSTPSEKSDDKQIDHDPTEKTALEILEAMGLESDEDSDVDSSEKTVESEEGDEVNNGKKIIIERGEDKQQFDLSNEKDIESLKEYAQKGYDYTQKTQELAKEKKEYDAEINKVVEYHELRAKQLEKQSQEFNEQIEQFNTFDYALKEMSEVDPELYEQVESYYKNAQKIQNTPMNRMLKTKVDMLEKELRKMEDSFTQRNQGEKLGYIAKDFTNEMKQIQEGYGPKLSKLGLNPNWEKVKQAWIAGDANNMSVEQAFFATYGPEIERAHQSKLALAQTKNKSNQRRKTPTMGSFGSKNLSGKVDLSKLSLDDMERSWKELF